MELHKSLKYECDKSTISLDVGGENIENIIGEERRNTYGTLMKIISARNKSDIDVQFLDEHEYIKRHAMYINFAKGQIKNPYDKNKYGVGYIGVGKHKSKVNGQYKNIIPKETYEALYMYKVKIENDKNYKASY